MKVNDFVRVKKSGDIGRVSAIEENRVVVYFEEIDYSKRYVPTSLEVIEPVHLTENDLKNIFRLNIAYMDIYGDIRLAYNYDYERPYQPNIDDLLSMLMNIKISRVTVEQFLNALYEINFILKPCYIPQDLISTDEIESILHFKEADVFKYILNCIDVNDLPGDDLVSDYYDIEEFIRVASYYKKNINKPLLEREYTEVIKDNFLFYVQDSDLFDELSEEYTMLFKCFMDELVAMDDLEALEILGYCYYGGNKLYPCDWYKSRDIFEKLYKLSGNAGFANSLGYIYYYGRCNNGIGEYQKAFQYFSIGAAAGIYESKYKLADMFRNGYFVTRNLRVAEDIYNELYEENLKIFSKGFFDCKFADIALRLGALYLERKNYVTAYYFLLQADFAIRKRMSNYNYYGDLTVFDKVTEAIETCRRFYPFETESYATMANLDILKLFFDEHHLVHFFVKELKGNKVKLTAIRKPFRDEYSALALMSLVSFNGCLLTDTLTLTALNVTYSKYAYGFSANAMEYDGQYVRFYENDDEVYCICCDEFRIDNPITDYPTDEFRLVRVKVNDQLIDYLCEDINVYTGREVIVSIDGKEKMGIVTKAFVREKSQLEKPVEQYSSIIKSL